LGQTLNTALLGLANTLSKFSSENPIFFVVSYTILMLLMLALGWVIGYLRAQRHVIKLRGELIAINTRLEVERQSMAQQIAAADVAQDQLANTFAALSRDALKNNNDVFLKLAEENLKQHQSKAEHTLSQKEAAVANLVRPIKDALEKTSKQLHDVELDRKQAYGALDKHLETMMLSQRDLQQETRRLVQALRRPEVRGQWGEITLKRLVELAGMSEHCDFELQVSHDDGDTISRPDMIVRLPDSRNIIVDAKTPLDSYLSAIESVTDEERQQHLIGHARKVKQRVRELASKAYWAQFKNTPDFVVLFIPGDQFLDAALEHDYNLLEYAIQQKVLLATSTSLIALLRAVSYGWRQQVLAQNADKIREVGDELYKRMATYSDHLAKLGRSLKSSVDSYNKAVGSFDRQLLPGARKFTEMGVIEKKEMADLEGIEIYVKTPNSHENDKTANQPKNPDE